MGSAKSLKVSFHRRYIDVIQTKGIYKGSDSSQVSSFTVVKLDAYVHVGKIVRGVGRSSRGMKGLQTLGCVPR